MAESRAEKAERELAEAEQAEQDRVDLVEEEMGADEFVVLAAYVTLKVKDQVGSFVIRGFNEGGCVKREDIDEASLRHHLDSGLLAPADAERARFAGPAGTPKPGEPPNVPITETPVSSLPLSERLRRQDEADKATQAAAKADNDKAGNGDVDVSEVDDGQTVNVGPPRPRVNAAKEDWVAYAVHRRDDGVSEADARADAETKSKNDLIAEFGG